MVVRSGTSVYAFALADVVETFRPLPTTLLSHAPPFILGAAIVRGRATPVVDLARLLEVHASGVPTRFVTLRLGARRVALAVEAVVGIRTLGNQAPEALPPLLSNAPAAIEQLATLDGELLHLMNAARLVPESLWPLLETAAPAPHGG